MVWLCLMHKRGEDIEMVRDRELAVMREVSDQEAGLYEPERRMVLYRCSRGCGNIITVEEQDLVE